MNKTIKYICGYFVALLPIFMGAQTLTENHIVSKTYKVESKTSLSTNDPFQIMTSIQYFDDLGRAKQSVLVKGGAGGYGNNIVKYDWTLGTPTNAGFYNLNGASSENQIINGTTPFGDTDLLWECVNDAASDPDGGWYTDYLDVDDTKAYRYTVWVKKSQNRTDGSTYHGTQFVNNLDGTSNNNPYFWYGDLPQLDTWYLLVGYMHPAGYTGSDLGISGVYDADGNKVIDGTEFILRPNTQIRLRNYLYYATDTNSRQYFWSPVLQKIDGNEDSLTDIINSSSVIDNQKIVAKDIVTHAEYDGFGRPAREYLPYASGNTDGRFDSIAKEKTQNYYLNHYAADFPGITDPTEVNAFSEKAFENNALQRPAEQSAPGLAWKLGDSLVVDQEYSKGHTIKFNYDFNGTNEVRYFPVTTTISVDTRIPSLGTPSYYSANELSKSILKDENWTTADGLNKTTEEFKDKSGQVVLKRTYNNSTAHDTYYVYDDFGNLTYVFPPKVDTSDGISATELSELCYQYVYDYRNRLVEKKIPGKGWEYIVYNRLDQPILTQDALLRQQDEWLFTKYDVLGRVVYTGKWEDGDQFSRESMQNEVNGSSILHEVPVAFSQTVAGTTLFYSDSAFPQISSEVAEIYTVTYYDTYRDLPTGLTTPTLVYDQEVSTNTQGLTTVSKVRILSTNNWTTTVSYFDEKARPVYIYSQNDYLQTTDIVQSQLDFTGKVLETKTTHSKVGITDDVVTTDRFEYDHMDRLINQSQKVNDELLERIARNNYDDLGQLKSVLTGSGTPKGYTDITSGISINNDTIARISGNGWDQGLATLGSFQADGYVEYEIPQTNKPIIVGLSDSNPSANVSSIDFAIYTTNSARLYIYESGVNLGNITNYTEGDVLRVERVGEKIYYKKNGVVFFISQKTSIGNLLGDISMLDGKINNLHIVDNSKGLQHVDYAYNVRGWLKSINDDTQDDNDLFNFNIKYNDPTSGTPLYNGNISQTNWSSASINTTANPVSNSYTYSYDALNRIISAIDNTGNYNLSTISYDKMGNILTLQRQGHTNATATLFGMMDNLSYTYDSGNKLTKVDDASGRTEGFKDVSGTDYTYDVNGNIISDNNKGIATISYNYLNLPTYVSFPSQQASISYVYDAMGIKQKKKISGAGINAVDTEYAGNYVYEKVNSGSSMLQFFNHSEGYTKYDNGDFDYIYQYKDHLGNIRLTYADSNENGSISLVNDQSFPNEVIEDVTYYPFGLKHKGYNNVVSSSGNAIAQKNKMFQGQMLDDELGLNWYGFKYRNYDPETGRFFNIDPLSSEYPFNSTYAFQENKLGLGVELEGLELAKFFETAWSGIKRVFVDPVKSERKRQAKQDSRYRKVKSGGPSKNITGNYFGDFVYKLAGGETISSAIDGNPKAQFRVLSNTILSAAPGGGRANVGDDIAKAGTKMSTKNIKFSQKSVNGVDDLVTSMKKNGWKGDPIDVVDMGDGLTAIDNTRLLAAHEAGIDVQAVVHQASDLLPESMAKRFSHPKKKGVFAKTWGEAAQYRIQNQGAAYRNANPSGSQQTNGN